MVTHADRFISGAIVCPRESATSSNVQSTRSRTDFVKLGSSVTQHVDFPPPAVGVLNSTLPPHEPLPLSSVTVKLAMYRFV